MHLAFAGCVDKKTTRILLIGRDPIFAWAIEQRISALGYHLEHVYTLAEARLRLNRFQYAAVLADGLGKDEVDLVSQDKDPRSAMFVFDDINLDISPKIETHPQSSVPVVIPKEMALQRILTSLKTLQ